MFTEKQIKEQDKYLKTARLEDLYTPDMPELHLPMWLPSEIKAIIEKQVEFASSHKTHHMRLLMDMWPSFVQYMITVLPAFTQLSMREMWEKLYKESKDKTVSFAGELLDMENEFEGTIRMFDKHRAEKECCERMIQKAAELHETMEEYYCHYYGHMIQDNHHKLMKTLETFGKRTQSDLETFKNRTGDISYLFTDYSPITREYKSEKALPIFFARKISLFFQREFGKPMHGYVANLIAIMFNVQFSDNEIIKMTKVIKPLLEGDNSP